MSVICILFVSMGNDQHTPYIYIYIWMICVHISMSMHLTSSFFLPFSRNFHHKLLQKLSPRWRYFRFSVTTKMTATFSTTPGPGLTRQAKGDPWKFCIMSQISLKLVPMDLFENKWPLVQVIYSLAPNKQKANEPMMTQFTDAHVSHRVSSC